MISLITLDGIENENKILEPIIRNQAAMLTEDKWNLSFFSKINDFNQFLENHPLIDFSCFDITIPNSVEHLQEFRKTYEESALMIIADATVSPLDYLKPGIRPDSLILRPLTKEIVSDTFKEFITSYIENTVMKDGIKSYVIDSKEGKLNIPYGDIYYFEAREKKVFIRTLSAEYGFYGTIDNIQESLPEYFNRCHRSYILNSTKITKIMLSQSLIELKDGFDVPLSRSYKPFFKKYGK